MKKENIIGINYWKHIRKEKKEIIGNLHGVVLLIHNSAKFPHFIDFINQIKPDKHLVLLYFSLINSWLNIEKILKEKPLLNKEIHVIDCASTLFLNSVEDSVHCVFQKPPENLESLKKMLFENIQQVNPNILVVDSLSQFINFTVPTDEELQEFYTFLKDLQKKIAGLSNDAIILFYDEDFGKIKSLPALNVDLILKYELIRGVIPWKG